MEQLKSLLFLTAAVVSHNSARNRHKITRSGIIQPKFSSWQFLYDNGDEQSFLDITGLSREAFAELESVLFDENAPKAGRKPILNNSGKLGLFLVYVGSRAQLKLLCGWFGVVMSSASRIVHEMMNLVVLKLAVHDAAKIAFPNEEKMEEYAAMVNNREPNVKNIIGFIDGLSLPIQCSDNELEQAKAYNGYYHDTMCNNVFAFAPTGKIIYACINYPGSWHDSQVSANLAAVAVEKLGNYAFCVDQGFTRSGELQDKFVGPLSEDSRSKLSPVLRDAMLNKHAIFISLRQAAEWGMRALQGAYPRLKSRLTACSKTRSCLIRSIVLLHNFKTERGGLNQIKTVFDYSYEQYVNLDAYDRIAKYF